MKKLLVALGLLSASLSGCVLGYGHCLFMEPVTSRLTGTLHYRKFPVPDSIDEVPILTLDRTAYIYSPAISKQCQSAHEIQLLPLSDLPDSVHENAHVEVDGSLALAADVHQHTRYVMNVRWARAIK